MRYRGPKSSPGSNWCETPADGGRANLEAWLDIEPGGGVCTPAAVAGLCGTGFAAGAGVPIPTIVCSSSCPTGKPAPQRGQLVAFQGVSAWQLGQGIKFAGA